MEIREGKRETPNLHDVEETKDLKNRRISIPFEDVWGFYNVNSSLCKIHYPLKHMVRVFYFVLRKSREESSSMFACHSP